MKIEDMTLEQAQKALRKVRAVAARVADEHGWCAEGRDDALTEIGLDPIGRGAVSKVTAVFDVEHEPGEKPDPAVIKNILEQMLGSEWSEYLDTDEDGELHVDPDVQVLVAVATQSDSKEAEPEQKTRRR